MTSTYGYQPTGPSAYSPFNRSAAPTGAAPTAPQYGAYAPAGAPPSSPAMGVDNYLPPSSPEDMDRLSSSIDSKIAQIRQAFSQPGPMTPGPQAMAPASAPAAVSQADVQWALDLENKVKGGQQPSPQDVARYEDIARRLQAAQTGAQAPAAPAAPAQAPAAPAAPPVPEADIQWALELENKVKGGQQPSPQDVARYEDIARRLQAAQAGAQAPAAPAQAPAAPAAPPVPEADIQWALALEAKVNSGQQPSPQDVARYEDIARRLQAAQAGAPAAPAAPAAANGPRDWANWSRPFAPPSVPNMPLPMAGPSGSPAIHVPTSLRGAPPTQPSAQAPAGVPTSLRAPAPAPQMAPAQAPQLPGGVSQQEIQWAMQLETRVNQQNYQPTPQEMAQYENIAQRLQAGQQAPAQQPAAPVPQAPAAMAPMTAPAQQPPAAMAPMTAPAPQMPVQQAPGGVSQQELDWALQLENRANNQGYTPTAQEMAQYENIAQRLQASRQGGAQQPGAYQPPVPQQPQFQQPTMPVVPQNYPMVQPGAAPQYLQAPQPFVPPQQAAAPGMPYPQQPGAPMPPQQQSPGMMDRLKNAWNALWS